MTTSFPTRPSSNLHVLAGTEAATGACEDRDLEVRALAEVGPDLRQQASHLMVQRVEPVRPVHPHDQDLSVRFGLDDGHVHHLSNFDTGGRSEEHTSELQSLMRSSYAVFCLK